MRTNILIAGAVAGSLLLGGCANSRSDDWATPLLIGAAVVGLGLLAGSDDGDDDDDYAYNSHGQGYGYGYGHQGRYRDDYDYQSRRDRYRHANNGRCDDPSYRTSNGGRASPGTDERDCRRYGDGLK